MGITGLLPLLKSALDYTHIEKYRHKTVAVDSYCWLHRGCYSCALELVEGKPTTAYVDFCEKRINLLIRNGITPYMVFDGQYLPSKKGKEKEREDRRKVNRAEGIQFLRNGNKTAAMNCFQKCVDVTPQMAYEVILLCRRMNISYVVAPYEADAQLAYLINSKIVDAIITEDSDLIPFGCDTVLFKMDGDGHVTEYQQSRLTAVDEGGVRFHGWTMEKFRQMCILSGCDYLPSISGMGLKKAYNFLSKYHTIENVIRSLQMSSKFKVPDGYLAEFLRAEATFKHQRVFDVELKRIIPLSPFDESLSLEITTSWIGPDLDDETAIKVAEGKIDPITKETFVMKTPTPKSNQNTQFSSFSKSNQKQKSSSKIAVAPNQKSVASFFSVKSNAASTKKSQKKTVVSLVNRQPSQNNQKNRNGPSTKHIHDHEKENHRHNSNNNHDDDTNRTIVVSDEEELIDEEDDNSKSSTNHNLSRKRKLTHEPFQINNTFNVNNNTNFINNSDNSNERDSENYEILSKRKQLDVDGLVQEEKPSLITALYDDHINQNCSTRTNDTTTLNNVNSNNLYRNNPLKKSVSLSSISSFARKSDRLEEEKGSPESVAIPSKYFSQWKKPVEEKKVPTLLKSQSDIPVQSSGSSSPQNVPESKASFEKRIHGYAFNSQTKKPPITSAFRSVQPRRLSVGLSKNRSKSKVISKTPPKVIAKNNLQDFAFIRKAR